ncbi:MAG: phosphatidylserine decarboxylase, partial [Desulfobacterales bacterium]|nr:phosphatidylserine decarboxylase [Desulfobacterales bacterium]
MPVGMAEVSSCKLSVKVGDPVQKGEELGYFQYGGSTYCLVFQPGVIKKFENVEGEAIEKGDAVVVRQKIAIAN